MTSIVRTYVATKEGLTRFVKPESPCYNEDGITRLFPFSFSRGVLDINYSGNNFQTIMVDSTGISPSDETDVAYRIVGSPNLVTSLGNNFKAYIRAWRDEFIDSGSPITLVEPAQIVRVQEGDYNSINANSSESWLITNFKPASDNYITGRATNNYQTTFIFKTPLTFSIKEDGVTRYITFRTAMDQE